VTDSVNQNGLISHLYSATILDTLQSSLPGVIGTRVNDEIEWSNGDVWANFDYDAINALFEMLSE